MENVQNDVTKNMIHWVTIVGYFFSDLCGVFVALLMYGLTKEMGLLPILSALASWGSAAATAGVLLSYVWWTAREPKAAKAKALKV